MDGKIGQAYEPAGGIFNFNGAQTITDPYNLAHVSSDFENPSSILADELAILCQLPFEQRQVTPEGLQALPDHLHVQPVTCTRNVILQRLEVEADEMASFMQKKANKQWIRIAMEAKPVK